MDNFKQSKLLLSLALICLVLGLNKSALAYNIELKDLNGRNVQLSNYLGKPVILFFWTIRCPYCREELKNLNRLYPALDKEGIVVLGVNVGEPEYKVRRFFEGYPLNFKILLDESGLLADRYNLLGVPTYVFLDKGGREISQAHSFPVNYKSLLF